MRLGKRLRTVAVVTCMAWAAPQGKSFADDAATADALTARKHFERARAYYGQGAYREALSELEAAHELDPSAKDLVFNLGVVHEKLADIDDALRWFRLFTTMDLTPQERDKADAYVRRLEGAKREMEQKRAGPTPGTDSGPQPQASALPQAQPTAGSPSTAPTMLPLAGEPGHGGRLDGWTIGAMSATVAAVAFGVVMAVRAKSDEPSMNFVTGSQDGTYTDLVNRQDNAHREAVLADVGFGVGLAGAVATAWLYFGRSATGSGGSTTLSAAPLKSGGTVLVGGSF
jgi:hypothetical protein